MKKIKIIDALGGHVHINKTKGKYFRTKDSTSKSGHSLLAQIDMTHSGIVTRNYGFYLPARMKSGAHTFTKDYNKPVLIGHDEVTDTKPVGRVVNAEYVDTSDFYQQKDSFLRNTYRQFNDSSVSKETMLDFVQHIIKEYDSRDSYRGLGHLRGTVKITDPDVIEGILNETYLTVSTSMVSDSAVCSVCGTDWVSQGLCDHSRGQTYDDNVCVVIPGKMDYDHLGIVNAPADPHAHDFTIISDTPGEKTILQIDNSNDLYRTNDHYDLAAQLFACRDKQIVSLASESDVNLIEIKDNIQKMENAMKTLEERVRDALDVKIEVYRFGNGEQGSKEVTVREYMEEDLNVEAVQSMVTQIAKLLKSDDSVEKPVSDGDIKKAVDAYCAENFELVDASEENNDDDPASTDDSVKDGFFGQVLYDDQVAYKGAGESSAAVPKKRKKKQSKKMSDKFKLEDNADITADMVIAEAEEIGKVEGHGLDGVGVVELAELVSLYKNDDALIKVTFNWKDKSYKDMVQEFKDWKNSLIILDKASGEDIYEKMKEYLGKDALSNEEYGKLKASDYCGMKGYFPVTDEAHLKAAFAVLSKCEATDSVKGRILSALYRKASRLGLDVADNFDSISEPCNNNDSISVEDAVKAYEDAKAQLIELGVDIPELAPRGKSEQESEIQILESQLEAANEELDILVEENNLLKTQLLEELATRTVDMKLLSGNFEIEDRVKEIDSHKTRSLDSLKDGIKDLETQFKIQDFVDKSGMTQSPQGKVEDPTLQQQDSKTQTVNNVESKEKENYELYDEYNSKVATYGKVVADRWLTRVQRQNGSIPTID